MEDYNKDEVKLFFENNLLEERLNRKNDRIYLRVKYDNIMEVKNMGAKFDWDRKEWYIYDTNRYKSYLISKYR